MNKYEVTGTANGVRKPKLVCRATDATEAWGKFLRAYSKDRCEIVEIRHIKPHDDDTGAAILALLSDGRARNTDDIAEEIELPLRQVAGFVAALVKRCEIRRIGEANGVGVYRIREAAE